MQLNGRHTGQPERARNRKGKDTEYPQSKSDTGNSRPAQIGDGQPTSRWVVGAEFSSAPIPVRQVAGKCHKEQVDAYVKYVH